MGTATLKGETGRYFPATIRAHRLTPAATLFVAFFMADSVMSPNQLSSMDHLLADMRNTVRRLTSPPMAAGQDVQGEGGFAAELTRSLARVSSLQNESAAQARAFELGVPGVALHDVVLDMQIAGLAFSATVQVRNRLVAAYQEFAIMPV